MRLIDADAIQIPKTHVDAFENCRNCELLDADQVREIIDSAPTIDVVPKDFHDKTCEAMAKRHTEEIQRLMPKRGKWIDMGDFEQCSVCKGTHLKEFQTYYGKATWIKTDFCPNCGADMRGKGDE